LSDIPTAHEQGQMCVRGFMGKIVSGKKFLRFKIPLWQEKQENLRMIVSVLLSN